MAFIHCHYTVFSFSSPSVLPWNPSQPTGFPLPVAPLLLSFFCVCRYVCVSQGPECVSACSRGGQNRGSVADCLPHLLPSILTVWKPQLSLNWKFIVLGWPASECSEFVCTPPTLMEIEPCLGFMWLLEIQTQELRLADPACPPPLSDFLLVVFYGFLSLLLLPGPPPPPSWQKDCEAHHSEAETKTWSTCWFLDLWKVLFILCLFLAPGTGVPQRLPEEIKGQGVFKYWR